MSDRFPGSRILFPRRGTHAHLCGIITGIFFPTALLYFWAWTHIGISVRTEVLPWYTGDAFIVGIATLEAIVSPFLGWLGYTKRRTVMMIIAIALALTGLLVLLLPEFDLGKGSVFCNSLLLCVEPKVFDASTVRVLVIVVIMCLMSTLANTAVWCHGVAYMDEHSADKVAMYVGIVLAARVVAPIICSNTMDINTNIYVVLSSIIISPMLQIVQLLRLPEQAPIAKQNGNANHIPMNDRELLKSFVRVLKNKLVMCQIFAIAFLTAGFWGFAWHQRDVAKVLYHTDYNGDWMSAYSEILRFHFVLLAMVLLANKFSTPVMNVFDHSFALKIILCLIAPLIPMYLVMVGLFSCEKTAVVGLVDGYVTQPACSGECKCIPAHNLFNPMCLVEKMQTYLSPCHAGCFWADYHSGTAALSNCQCGLMNQRALVGACNNTTCVSAYELYKMVYVIIVIFVVMAIQLQTVLILRNTNPRDRSVTLGIAGSVVAVTAFILGHMTFFAIRVSTCAWFEAGSCQFHSSWFPYYIAGSSAAMTLMALLITLLGLYLWSLTKDSDDPIPPAPPAPYRPQRHMMEMTVEEDESQVERK